MDSSTSNVMNILQQFSQLMFLQSLAAGKTSIPMNRAMFGFPQSQQSLLSYQSQAKPLLPPLSPTMAPPHLQTISDLLSSHQILKSQLSPSPSQSDTLPFKAFNEYENVQQHRQYKVHVTRESAKPLQDWMNQHITNPYPTSSDVKQLSMQTGFTFKQIRNWFTNNRRRFEQNSTSNSIPWVKKDSPKASRKIVTKSESEGSENSVESALLQISSFF